MLAYPNICGAAKFFTRLAFGRTLNFKGSQGIDFLWVARSASNVVEFAPFCWANNLNRFYMVIIRLSRGGSKNRPFYN
ncbi:MAG TPA: hypothetical protein VFQ99_02820, partial [Gallionella sp.]|nr:hypothetical protein [Gallionella sp.]